MKKNSFSNLTIPALLLLDGLTCTFIAVFADQLGIDPAPNWGRFRYMLLSLGVGLLFFTIFLFLSNKMDFRFLASIQKVEWIKTAFLLSHIWLGIFIIYTWFITFGTFTNWGKSTRYYMQLADAFAQGQLNIDTHPGEAFLSSEDPYSSTARAPFDDEIWDMSLYNEKLYLYWGPVPALIITPIQIVSNASITDIYLVYFFLCGLLIFNSLIILKLWRLFFTETPARAVVLCIFLIGCILPILWSLNIPDVYEAAIGAGQFFLIGGIYFAILAFENGIKKRHLVLTGLFWACSVGSRAINVFPILFLTALTLFSLWKNHPNPIHWKKITPLAVALLAPLAFGAILIGWYNWARFDNLFEFGLRYQITIYNLNRNMHLVFHPGYFPFNFYAYLFQPFEFITHFPFIQPIKTSELMKNLGIATPHLFSGGRVTGILFHAPFLFLAILPFLSKKTSEQNTTPKPQLLNFILHALSGSFLISFATILFYFYGQMRFLVDLISQITLLAIIGYWLIIQNSKSSKTYLHLANLLVAITLAASLLLSFSSETNRMGKVNPALMEKINSFFVPQK
jgi:hypothetical protein